MGYGLYHVRKEISSTLKPDQARELSPERRQRLEKYLNRTFRIVVVSTIFLAILVGCCLLYGVSYPIAKYYSWIFVPIIGILNGFWVLRMILNRLKFVLRSRLTELHSSSGHGTDGEATKKVDKGTQPVPLLGVKRKQRKLKGIRRKPLELMSAVAERTQEGSVMFTHVEGLESLDSHQSLSHNHYSGKVLQMEERDGGSDVYGLAAHPIEEVDDFERNNMQDGQEEQ